MKVNYVEGTWFAIPLRNGGYAAGLVARATSEGPHVLAYLFGPRRESIPSMAEVARLDQRSAIKVARIGDLHLLGGKWPIIGSVRDFERAEWPFPKFVRSDEITRRAWIVEYDDDDPGKPIAETPTAFGTPEFDRDAAFGAGAVELLLTKLLEKEG